MPIYAEKQLSEDSVAVFRFFRFLFCCDLLDFFCTDGIISTVDAYLVCKAVISNTYSGLLMEILDTKHKTYISLFRSTYSLLLPLSECPAKY